MKGVLSRTCLKIYSRTMTGLTLPGRYYFLTLTSSPESPPIQTSFDALRQYLKRERKGCCWIYVMTSEGHGVIHMVIRLAYSQKNFDIKHLRKFWKKQHKARQIRIERCKTDHEKLAEYLSDQRRMKKMGSEMSWQDMIIRWGWSKGWIPKGFGVESARLWHDWINADRAIKEKVIRDACLIRHNEVKA